MRDRNRRGGDIAQRLLDWAAALVRLVEALPQRRWRFRLSGPQREADELIAILVASARTARTR